MDKNLFWSVYDAVVYGRRKPLGGDVVSGCLEVASLNKVLLHFLRVAGVQGGVRRREERRYALFVEGLRRVAGALEGLDYAFFKLRKPAVYVPSDVDVLVPREQVSRAVRRLVGAGFRVEVVEPYCVTMARGSVVVDLYVHPTLGGVVYLDGRGLLEHSGVVDFYGVEARALETYAEAVVAVAHAVYKERIYTLNDYVTVVRWFSRRSFELAVDLGVVDAVSLAMRVHEGVEGGRLVLPYRVPLPVWAWVWAAKVAGDGFARGTVKNLVGALGDRRIGLHVLSKLTRRTY